MTTATTVRLAARCPSLQATHLVDVEPIDVTNQLTLDGGETRLLPAPIDALCGAMLKKDVTGDDPAEATCRPCLTKQREGR